MTTIVNHLLRTFRVAMTRSRKSLVVTLALLLMTVSLSAAPVRKPTITLLYTTAETSTSAAVVWNTNYASDSFLQYSTSNPIPADAPQLFLPAQVTYHEFQLSELTPATLYYFRVKSCNKKGCAAATSTFDTYPTCPDMVPPVSGSWQRDESPNVGGATELRNVLLGVDAVSENDVWAVGWSQEPDAPPYIQRTLIEHFDGTAWNIVPSPNPVNDTSSVLHAVSASSANDVWAVGTTHNGTFPGRTLIEHWNGTHWSIVPSPSPDSQFNELRGVAAISATNAWAVGYRSGTQNETPIETLILHWDGFAWTQVPSPNVPAGANQLFGMTPLSANDIWAVGSVGGAPLALHWDGSAWSVVPVNGHGGMVGEFLTGISGTAGHDLWAVGQGRGFFSNRAGATLRHWNGVHWTLKVCYAASPSNPPPDYEGGGPDSYLTGVSAAGSNEVWAVGVVGAGPFIRHWDGEAWTQVTHPRAFPNSAVLRGVATSISGKAWAVGFVIHFHPSGSASPERTLIHRYVP